MDSVSPFYILSLSSCLIRGCEVVAISLSLSLWCSHPALNPIRNFSVSRAREQWPIVHHIWKTWINIHAHKCRSIEHQTVIYLYCVSFRIKLTGKRQKESTGAHMDYVTFCHSVCIYFVVFLLSSLVHQCSITMKSLLHFIFSLSVSFIHSHAFDYKFDTPVFFALHTLPFRSIYIFTLQFIKDDTISNGCIWTPNKIETIVNEKQQQHQRIIANE